MFPIGDEDRSRKYFPLVTIVLVLFNIGVFYFEVTRGQAFIERWAFVPGQFAADPLGIWYTLFTALFLHAGLLHIASNMIYLYSPACPDCDRRLVHPAVNEQPGAFFRDS